MEPFSYTIRVEVDKPGRSVTVAAGMGARPVRPGLVIIEVGGRIGESEWSWLTAAQAREVADALNRAAAVADQETMSS
jgi:hypothetical protein